MQNQFTDEPISIKEMGNEVFLKQPIFRKKCNSKVIYINQKLYEKIFNKPYNFEEASKDILDKFLVTLSGSDDVLGYGYIDRQNDPTNISLAGNEGSGRALYLYKNFNLKGDKTPFATSPRAAYNNGKYPLDAAIQESLVSNVLDSFSEFDNFTSLAIIKFDEKFLFPYMDYELPCAYIIRYYEDKELYRFSHRFVNNKPFTKKEILDTARKLGTLEGNKFIKRFLHGAWSIGNMSINSNMIDLDTSYFVIGRHPQWSFTYKYITNYFGYEQYGQVKLLEIVLDSDLNKDKVTKEEVEDIIISSRTDTIRKSFISLMGYDLKLYDKYKDEIDRLADEFEFLSRLMYDNTDNLRCVDEYCEKTNVFDFSKFFRYYEIYKQSDTWSIPKGLSLLINRKAEVLDTYYDERTEKINDFFKDIIVDDPVYYFNLIIRANKFVENYDALNNKIDTNERINKNEKLIKAYLENENKTYLTARKWIRDELIELYRLVDDKIINNIINLLINVYSNRDYSNETFKCDLVLYNEGALYREIGLNGYNRFCFKMFENCLPEYIYLRIKNEEIKLKRDKDNTYYSEYIKNTLISTDSISIHSEEIEFNEIGRDLKCQRTNSL